MDNLHLYSVLTRCLYLAVYSRFLSIPDQSYDSANIVTDGYSWYSVARVLAVCYLKNTWAYLALFLLN